MKEKRDIKEVMEFLKGVKVLAILGGKITADGKINIADLKHLVDAAKDFEVIMAGVKDMDDAMAEIKDLDEVEAVMVITELFSMIKAFKDARK